MTVEADTLEKNRLKNHTMGAYIAHISENPSPRLRSLRLNKMTHMLHIIEWE